MTCPSCNAPLHREQVRVHPLISVTLIAVGSVLTFVYSGSLLHDLIEGMLRSELAYWQALLPLAVLLAGWLALFRSFAREVCTACEHGVPGWLRLVPAKQPPPSAARRQALRVLSTGGATLAAGVTGIGIVVGRNRGWVKVADEIFKSEVESTAPVLRDEWRGSRVRNYRRLGRTNFNVSDIAVGTGRFQGTEVARMAMERGVTYFDTAPDYAENGSEIALGAALRDVQRDKIFVATKFCLADGHLPNDTPVPEIISAIEGSLQRLNTDYVDLIHVHSCDSVDRLMAPNIHEAFDRLKEQGKARFMGVSTHTPNLEEVANAAIDSQRFDVMMLAYHHGIWGNLGPIIEKAHAADVGIVAMKTLKGAKHQNLAKFQREAGAYSQAAFRWVLSNPNVSCLVVSFSQLQHVDEYLYASGQELRDADVAMLDRYDELTRGDYCQPHCGVCLDSCSYDLPINDILRYRMYYRDYGWEGEGLRRYAKLENDASHCLGCPAPCAGQCPIGVPIREKMIDAHRLLRMA